MKIDIIYAYPLLGWSVILLTVCLIIYCFRIKKSISELKDNYIDILRRLTSQYDLLSKVQRDTQEFKSSSSCAYKEGLSAFPIQKTIAKLKFSTMQATEPGLNITLPLLEIEKILEITEPESITYRGGEEPKSFIFWEGLMYILEHQLSVSPDNVKQVLNDFNSWKSKPAGDE